MSAPNAAPAEMPQFPLSEVPKGKPVVRTAGCIVIGDEVLNGKTKVSLGSGAKFGNVLATDGWLGLSASLRSAWLRRTPTAASSPRSCSTSAFTSSAQRSSPMTRTRLLRLSAA